MTGAWRPIVCAGGSSAATSRDVSCLSCGLRLRSLQIREAFAATQPSARESGAGRRRRRRAARGSLGHAGMPPWRSQRRALHREGGAPWPALHTLLRAREGFSSPGDRPTPRTFLVVTSQMKLSSAAVLRSLRGGRQANAPGVANGPEQAPCRRDAASNSSGGEELAFWPPHQPRATEARFTPPSALSGPLRRVVTSSKQPFTLQHIVPLTT
jgi:hypothetical protein